MNDFLQNVAQMYAPFRKQLTKSLLLLIFIEGVGLLSPYIFGRLINASTSKNVTQTILAVAAFLVVKLIYCFVDYRRDKLSMTIDLGAELHIATKTIRKILGYSIGQHHNQNSGIKQQIIKRGESAYQQVTNMSLWHVLPLSCCCLVTTAMLLCSEFSMGLIVLWGCALFALRTARTHAKHVGPLKKARREDRRTGKIQGEIFRNVELIKLNAQEKKTAEDYAETLSKTNALILETYVPIIGSSYGNGLVPVFTISAIYLVGGLMACYGKITVGDAVTYISWANVIIWRVQNLAGIQRRFMDWHVDIERYNRLMQVPCDIKVPENPIRPDSYLGQITFENVTFSYKNDKNKYVEEEDEEDQRKEEGDGQPAISNLSFTLEAGRRYAIVGESGSGKSTIRYLMLGAYEPEQGKILIDGIDVRALDPEHFLKNVGVVDQEVMLYDTSLRENILWARNKSSLPKLSEEELLDICRKACIDRFFGRLEHGLDTLIWGTWREIVGRAEATCCYRPHAGQRTLHDHLR